MSKRYYYKRKYSLCLEVCTKHDGLIGNLKIGSDSCSECKYNQETNRDKDYIKCEKYPEGQSKRKRDE